LAIASPYALPAEYRVVIQKTGGEDDVQLLDDLTAVSRLIDHRLNRCFNQSDSVTPEARLFYPRVRSLGTRPYDWAERENPWRWGGAARWLEIDDLALAPTSITIDEQRTGSFAGLTPLAATDYELRPLNATSGPEAKPYTSIYLPDWSTLGGGFPGSARVQVVGVWGWPAVPIAIKQATIQLTGILRLESPRATRTIDEMNRVISMSQIGANIINDLLSGYSRAGFGI
jgi:hypothetical protein